MDYESAEREDRWDEACADPRPESAVAVTCTTCRDCTQQDVRHCGDEMMCAACRARLRAWAKAQQASFHVLDEDTMAALEVSL